MGKTNELSQRLRALSFEVEEPEVAGAMAEASEWLREINWMLTIYKKLENGIDLRCRLATEDKEDVEEFWEAEEDSPLKPCQDKHHQRFHFFRGQKDYESIRHFRD